MTTLGCSGTPTHDLPRRIAFAVTALAALATPSIGQIDTILPLSEAEFRKLLAGCWSSGEFAHLADGTYVANEIDICFEERGLRTSFAAGADGKSDARGTFSVSEDRLHLANGGSPDWPFEVQQFNCDAVITPAARLDLTNCMTDGAAIAVQWSGFVGADDQ